MRGRCLLCRFLSAVCAAAISPAFRGVSYGNKRERIGVFFACWRACCFFSSRDLAAKVGSATGLLPQLRRLGFGSSLVLLHEALAGRRRSPTQLMHVNELWKYSIYSWSFVAFP